MLKSSEVCGRETALEKERARVAELVAEQQQRDGQIGDLIQVVNKAVRDAAESRAAAAALAAKLQTLTDQTKEVDATKRDSLQIRAENDRLRGELEKSHSHAAELRLEIEQLQGARQDLRSEVDLLKCIVAELEQGLQEKRELLAKRERDDARRATNNAAQSQVTADDLNANDDAGVYLVHSRTLVEQDECRQQYPLIMPTIVVGRSSDCDIRIGGDYTSRRHALLVNDDRGTIIEDLGSSNGVKVNSASVKSHRLQNGDTVQIGKKLFKFFDAPQDSRSTKRTASG